MILEKQRLRIFYKTINQDTHIYLQDIVPNRNTQNAQNQLPPISGLEHHSSQINFYRKLFWNNLDNDRTMGTSLESFTNNLIKS